MAPGTLTGGITLNYMDEGGKTYVKTTQKEVTFTAGKITYLGALDANNFTEALNAAFANAVEEFNPNIGWTANPDGTVSLDENNRMEIIMNGGTFLFLRNKNITSLAGIEYFTYLETLDCMDNQLTTLDVTKLTNLTTLICSGNQLTALDVTKLTNLTDLECNDNQLVSLNVSTLEELKYLWCHGNKMTALDITNNAYLGDLKCGNQQDNQQLTLTLWDTKKEFWDRMLNRYSDENSNVTTIVKPSPVEAEHNDFEDGDDVEW
ncbi:conserved repeat protein [Bacteroides sp. CAG:633]|nr:conserved repeat protein [Bacteroides sp. CAG:633]